MTGTGLKSITPASFLLTTTRMNLSRATVKVILEIRRNNPVFKGEIAEQSSQ